MQYRKQKLNEDCRRTARLNSVYSDGIRKIKRILADSKDLNLQVYFIFDENGSWKTQASENLKKIDKEVH